MIYSSLNAPFDYFFCLDLKMYYHKVFVLLYSVWTYNLANNISTMSARVLIFHMSLSIHCDKTFFWGTHIFLPCNLDFEVWHTFWKL